MKNAAILLIVVLSLMAPSFVNAQTVPRLILIEYFNGTWAEWGPRGDDSLMALQMRWPNTRTIAYHLSNSTATDPMETTNGNIVRDSLAAGFCPGAVFDRIVWQVTSTTYSFILDWTLWEQAVAIRMSNSPTTPMSINAGGSYDSVGRQVTGIATIGALQAMSGTYYAHVVVTEDDLDYAQQKNTGSSVITVQPYLHKRVVRIMVTGAMGSLLTTTGFTANQVINVPLNFTLPVGIDWRKAHITVFVDVDFGIPFGHRYVQQAWQGAIANFTILPVELVSFTGDASPDGVRIAWRTSSENNNMGWHVERRALTEEAWSDLGFVNGGGTTRQGRAYEFTDRSAAHGIAYDYRLLQKDYDGSSSVSPVVRVTREAIPQVTALLSTYPNPFQASTQLTADLAVEGPMKVEVLDVMGRIVATPADGQHHAGRHTITWDGRDAFGRAMPAGTYYARMTTRQSVQTRQLLMVR